MERLTVKSSWKIGEPVRGSYYSKLFTGVLNDLTRPTPDYKNMMFCITLTSEFELFGTKRNIGESIYIHTNDRHDNFVMKEI